MTKPQICIVLFQEERSRREPLTEKVATQEIGSDFSQDVALSNYLLPASVTNRPELRKTDSGEPSLKDKGIAITDNEVDHDPKSLDSASKRVFSSRQKPATLLTVAQVNETVPSVNRYKVT